MRFLPLFYYPTTVMVLNDDAEFLQTLGGILNNKNLLSHFNNHQHVLQFFSTYKPFISTFKFLRGCFEQENYDDPGHMPVDVDFSHVRQLCEDQRLQTEVSVLIIDFSMAEMNGLDVCRRLKALPCKKILLTSDESHELAITAFNEALIDCYIPKSSSELSQDIYAYIKSLNHTYLIESSKQLSRHLETDYQLPISDPVFIHFFEEFCESYEIQSYFILDELGNFLLKDKKGDEYYFIIYTDRTLNQFVELYGEDAELREHINEIRWRQKIPFFGEDKVAWQIDMREWGEYLFLPQLLLGRETYYWAFIQK